ncbi:hypothetical protein ACGFI9_09870 [Micromonospora sp. NPDC048930]|uniref:hypothetical protein n=1 Tax=Micromonospora sp. NPDC048930 TaxID=3364261 RepID=UPI003722922F
MTEPLVFERWRSAAITADPAAFLNTSQGPLYLTPTLLATASPDLAWLGIQDLHLRALDRPGRWNSPTGTAMSTDDAFGLYSSALTSVLGQLSVTGPAAANRLLESLTDFTSAYGMDGLEAPFLNAYGAALRGGPSQQLDDAANLWSAVGLPDTLGGGAATVPLFDTSSGRLTMPDADTIGQVLGGGGPYTVESMARGLDTAQHSTSGAAPEMFQDAAHAVHQVGSAISSTGRLVEHFVPGVGEGLEAVGSAVSRIGEFFEGLFGGGQSTPASSAAQAQQVTQGSAVAIQQSHVVDQEQRTITFHKNGDISVTETHTHESHTQRQTIEPAHPAKCERGDDGTFDAGFEVPYWGRSAGSVPSITPLGPGLDAMFAVSPGCVFLQSLPTLDDAGELISAGYLAEVLMPAGLRLRGRVARPGGGRWNLGLAYRPGARQAIVDLAAAVLREATRVGLRPTDPAAERLAHLHRLGY